MNSGAGTAIAIPSVYDGNSTLNNPMQTLAMKTLTQVIARLLPDSTLGAGAPKSQARTATMLVRDAEGHVLMQYVHPDSVLGADEEFARQALDTGSFRRSKPIVDPVSHKVLGYEMELVPNPISMR
jgi:hypothetical protein